MDQFPRIRYLLNRYLDNTCTRQEMDDLLNHIQRYPGDEHLRSVLKERWDAEKRLSDTEAVPWNEMLKRLGDTKFNKNMSYRQSFFLKVAASILLATCSAGFFFWNVNKNASHAESQPLQRSSVETADDEHRLIVLSDSSKVWINGNSKLTCAPVFNNTKREVTLCGEAFFDIRHDPERPFIIKTGEVKTTVLGTAFNIRAFPRENTVIVTVARGKVRVEASNKKGATIEANQQIRFDRKSNKLETHEADAATVSQWIQGNLIFNDITSDECGEILEQRYSLDIRFDYSLLEKCCLLPHFFNMPPWMRD